MELEKVKLRRKDHKKIIQYAIEGMHSNAYIDNKVLLNLYGKYSWYLELTNATKIIAAYIDNEIVGVLVANMVGEKKKYRSFCKTMYMKVFEVMQRIIFKDGVDLYDSTNKEMLDNYKKERSLDGEISFFVVKSDMREQGIGTKILNEFENIEKGKEIYLFTDDNCTYQFYEHRGFERVGEKNIILTPNNKKVPLKCLLYVKKIK